MNKVLNINLGGYPFSIDTDAYEHLSKYLKTIHTHFKSSEGYEEITSDIEARMAELFQESLGNQLIVTREVVDDAITIMGTPADFGATNMNESKSADQTRTRPFAKSDYKTGKRLFRDPEDEIVSGVCSGIAAYFGIEDPLWVRLGFVVFTVTGGFGIPIYILLAILVPKAKTSSDRLAMRGDAINVSSIAKVVEEEFTNISDKITEMTDNWDSKKKSFTGASGGIRRPLKEGVLILGKFIRHLLNILPLVLKPLIFIVGFALLVACIVIWILSIISFFFGLPFAAALTPDQPFLTYLLLINLIILVGVPILSLALLAGRLVFKTKYNVKWRKGLWGLWTLNIVSVFFVGSFIARQFSVEKTVETYSEVIPVSDNQLHIVANENPYEDTWLKMEDLRIAGKELASTNVHLHIRKADDNQFSLVQKNRARGEDVSDATQTASMVRHNFDIKNNALTFNPYFVLDRGEKWRNQEAILHLYVPEGKSITFDKLPNHIRYHIHFHDYSEHHHRSVKNGETWTLTKDGFTNPNQQRHHKERKNHTRKGQRLYADFSDFNALKIKGKIKVDIQQGANYAISVDGKEQYLNKVQVQQEGEMLKVSTNLRQTSSPIRVNITLPVLASLSLSGTDDIKIAGFDQDKMAIKTTGDNRDEVKANINVKELTLDLNSRLGFDLRGTGNILIAHIKDRAELDAERFAVRKAKMRVEDRGSAALAVSDTLMQNIRDRGDIDLDGEPVVIGLDE